MTIFICGVPRAGKTTLAKKLKEEIKNSNLLVTEAIRNGFQKIDEVHAKEWGRKTSSLRQDIFPAFVKEVVAWNEEFTKTVTILDCALIDLKRVESIASKNDVIICLGFGGRENDEIFSYIRQYESENDYTKAYSDDVLIKLWGDISKIDKSNQEFCRMKDIKYFDTTQSRNKTQSEIIEYIAKAIQK